MGLLATILIALGLKTKVDEHSHRAATNEDADGEASDDAGSFDFDRDIARWFTAEFQVEQAWEDEPKRALLFREYGVRDAKHWHQIQATFERWTESPAGRARYPTPSDWMQAKMTTTQTLMMSDLNLHLRGEVEPVEGISLEVWAAAHAKLANGGEVGAIIAGLGIDQGKWERVSAEWNSRRSRDASARIATAYGRAVMADRA